MTASAIDTVPVAGLDETGGSSRAVSTVDLAAGRNGTAFALTHPVLVEETEAARSLRHVALFVAASLGALITWAAMAEIHEVSTASGMIVPSGFERVVQHYEGGIIREILVRAGDRIQEGQPLFQLEDGATGEDLDVAVRQKADIDAQIEGLTALTTNRDPDFSAFDAETATRAADYYGSRKDANTKERGLIQSQIEQARAILSSYDAQLGALADDKAFAEENFARIEGLVQKGYATRSVLAERRKAVIDAENAIRIAIEKKAAAAEHLKETEQNLVSFDARFRADLSTQIVDLRSQLTAMTGDVSKKTRRQRRLTVTSPVNGLVKSLNVTTIGGVISRGEPLATIVPLDEKLTAEADVPVSEIGYLRVGLPAHVKVSAFDFTQFGWIEGTVSEISPSSFADQGREPYYKLRIDLETDHLPGTPSARISPGMVVAADIITGERSVLSYILSPVSRAMKTAFAER